MDNGFPVEMRYGSIVETFDNGCIVIARQPNGLCEIAVIHHRMQQIMRRVERAIEHLPGVVDASSSKQKQKRKIGQERRQIEIKKDQQNIK